MEELRYPVGLQTFSEIIEEGYAYVDKTGFIPPLLKHGKYIFLSRPRRFGKSLFVSTLKAFFEGRHTLFKGLGIDMVTTDWTPSPVLHFDFNSENYTLDNGLDLRLDSCLRNYESIYGRQSEDISPAQRFESLIKAAYNQNGKVVILIDEYDKPLLGLENFQEIFEKNQRILKSFFGNLKSMDEYIRFAFITGVARFNKVSIFSDINNLKDISMDDRFADICGWTEEELTDKFRSGIEELAVEREESFETVLKTLRDYYDGYLFTAKGSRVFNPFSVLSALDSGSIEPYWFDSGTPTFLVDRIKANRIDPMELNGGRFPKRALMQVSINPRDPIPLMFQTGYLTIDTYEARSDRYTLRFPNLEVEKAFAEDLLPLYVKDINDSLSPFNIFNFQDDLNDGCPKEFMQRLSTLFKDLPGEDHRESTYRAITYLLCKLCTLETHAEQRSYKGRSDLEVLTAGYIYIFEFKYGKSVKDAMEQIKSRDYAGRYAMDSRQLYLIGVNYDTSKERRILDYEIQKVNG